MFPSIPKYKDLPIQEGAPPGSAWGVFDKNGQRDVFGTLNFATREAVVAAKEEILTGESVVLNLPLHLPLQPAPGRAMLKHSFLPDTYGYACCDDEITINTQSTSQWDGFLHWAHQSRREYYNGVSYEEAAKTRTDKSLGIHCLSERGGIVARGVLLDFVRYAAMKGIEYDVLSNFPITLQHLKDMVNEEGLVIRPGDILLVRTGIGKWHRESTPEMEQPKLTIGVDPASELLEWIWDSNFAAVGSDAIAFECIPAPDGSMLKFHDAALPGWGMHIGELLDLEALSKVAEENKRWSFFLTICPLNLHGGAATLANTLAVF